MKFSIKKAALTLGLLIAGISASFAQSNGMYDKIVYQHVEGSTQYHISYTITVTPQKALLVITPNFANSITEELWIDNATYSDVLMTLAVANLNNIKNPCGNTMGDYDQVTLFDDGQQLFSGSTTGGNCANMSGAYGAVIYKLRSLFPDFDRQLIRLNTQADIMQNNKK